MYIQRVTSRGLWSGRFQYWADPCVEMSRIDLLLMSPLLFLVFCGGKVLCQRTGTGPQDRGNPEYRPGRYDTGRWGNNPTNTEVSLVPTTGTGAKDRMGGGGGDFVPDGSISPGQLVLGPNERNPGSNSLAVNLTHALAVDQGIAEAVGEEAYLGILR